MFAEFLATIGGMMLAVHLLPGLSSPDWKASALAGAIMAVLYLVIRPLAKLITKPLGCLTFGLIGIIVDTAIVEACAWLMKDSLTVENVYWAAGAALIVNALRLLAGKLFKKKDDD